MIKLWAASLSLQTLSFFYQNSFLIHLFLPIIISSWYWLTVIIFLYFLSTVWTYSTCFIPVWGEKELLFTARRHQIKFDFASFSQILNFLHPLPLISLPPFGLGNAWRWVINCIRLIFSKVLMKSWFNIFHKLCGVRVQ